MTDNAVLVSDSSQSTPPPLTEQHASPADLLAWSLAHLALPLVPFATGAGIRWMVNGAPEWLVLDPAQLSFTLAVLCLLRLQTAIRLHPPDEPDVASPTFIIGLLLFMILFALSTQQTAQLSHIQRTAMAAILNSATTPALAATDAGSVFSGQTINGIHQNLQVLLACAAGGGAFYAIVAIYHRYRYGPREHA